VIAVSIWDSVGQFGQGVWDSTAGAVVQIVQHPIETVQGVATLAKNAVTDPVGTAQQLGHFAGDVWEKAQENPAYAAGFALGTVAPALLTGGGSAAAEAGVGVTRVAEVANAATKAGEVADAVNLATKGADAANLITKGADTANALTKGAEVTDGVRALEGASDAARAGEVGGVTAGAAEDVPKLGGAYRDVPANGGQVHHTPADSISPLSRREGPGFRMETDDHMDTASWGRGKAAQEYRAQQEQLISEGKFREAQQMDIDDVRSKFGDKYDEGIQQMLDYTDTLDPEKYLPEGFEPPAPEVTPPEVTAPEVTPPVEPPPVEPPPVEPQASFDPTTLGAGLLGANALNGADGLQSDSTPGVGLDLGLGTSGTDFGLGLGSSGDLGLGSSFGVGGDLGIDSGLGSPGTGSDLGTGSFGNDFGDSYGGVSFGGGGGFGEDVASFADA
jgi:hypothetical protein